MIYDMHNKWYEILPKEVIDLFHHFYYLEGKKGYCNKFRNLNLNPFDCTGIFINILPEENSNGLLFGSYGLNNKKVLKLEFYLKNNFIIDHNINNSLEHWADQGILMLNLKLFDKLDLEKSIKVINSILYAMYNIDINVPIVVFDEYDQIKYNKFRNVFNLESIDKFLDIYLKTNNKPFIF